VLALRTNGTSAASLGDDRLGAHRATRHLLDLGISASAWSAARRTPPVHATATPATATPWPRPASPSTRPCWPGTRSPWRQARSPAVRCSTDLGRSRPPAGVGPDRPCHRPGLLVGRCRRSHPHARRAPRDREGARARPLIRRVRL
jgi:hypothetical protein